MTGMIPALLASAWLALAGSATGAAELSERKDNAMAEDRLLVLSNSRDPAKLHAAAASLLESPEAEDRARLLGFLSRAEFLNRLDSPADYQRGAKYLRIARLIKAMRNSAHPATRGLLVELMQQREFIAEATRVELLIWASVVLRPAPPAVVQFWDDHCRPDDCFAALVAKALADNGSPPAVELLERKLAAPEFEDDERIWWMRTAILTHRRDVPILKACARLLEGPLPPALKPELVAVLFDYRPSQWHGPDGMYPPPPETRAGAESRQILMDIGEHALAGVELDPRLRQIVRAKVEELKSAGNR